MRLYEGIARVSCTQSQLAQHYSVTTSQDHIAHLAKYTIHTASSCDAQIFSDAPDTARWIVPIHHVVVHNMVAMATQADQTLRQNGNAAPGKLSAAATYLQSSIFSETLRKGTHFCFIRQ